VLHLNHADVRRTQSGLRGRHREAPQRRRCAPGRYWFSERGEEPPQL